MKNIEKGWFPDNRPAYRVVDMDTGLKGPWSDSVEGAQRAFAEMDGAA